MNNDLISRKALPEKMPDEFVGINPEIIVTDTVYKPYFQIRYYDPKAKEGYIGFGSYCLENVFGWLKGYFGTTKAKVVDYDAPSVEAEPKRGNGCDFCNGKEKLILSIDGCCADEFSMEDLNKWQKIRFCPLCGAKMDLEVEE